MTVRSTAALLCLACSVVACAPTPPHARTSTDLIPPVSMGALQSERSDPSPETLSVEEWSFGDRRGHIIRTRHYRIYTTETDRVLRERVAGFVEYALAHYRSAIIDLPSPPQRLDTYLMDNRPQWVQLTHRLMGPEAERLTQIRRGGYASRGIGVYYDLGLYDTLAIAAHEGWHQYTQRTFRDSLPIWLEEGLATYMEGHRWRQSIPVFLPWANLERFDALSDAARDGKLLSLEQLLQGSPSEFIGEGDDSILTYYAQLWALTHFLREGEGGKYAPALDRLLRDAAQGNLRRSLSAQYGRDAARSAVIRQSGPMVFGAYFRTDFKRASREYEAFVRALVSGDSRNDISAGRSPIRPPMAAETRSDG